MCEEIKSLFIDDADAKTAISIEMKWNFLLSNFVTESMRYCQIDKNSVFLFIFSTKFWLENHSIYWKKFNSSILFKTLFVKKTLLQTLFVKKNL